MKGPQRDAMKGLPPDRKQFLIHQHQQSSSPTSRALRPPKTGPDLDTGALAGLKRFSLAGWTAPPVTVMDSRPSTMYDGARGVTQSDSNGSVASFDVSLSSNFVDPQPDPTSNWSSWWTASSNATGLGQAVGDQAKDTPQFYEDQLRSGKISQRSLVKHLIALRVRLATAKMSWTEQFLDEANGIDALEALLGRITLKRVNQCVVVPPPFCCDADSSCTTVARDKRTKMRQFKLSVSSAYEF